MVKEITKCRVCGNTNLVSILNLGNQALTGIFPRTKEEVITSGPLELVKCHKDHGHDCCDLLQLRCSYDLDEMYGNNYGYQSGINSSMAGHLHAKVNRITDLISLNTDDIILDIGSNDSTLLQAYPKNTAILVGMDPTGKKFKEYYPDHINLIPEFFSAKSFKKIFQKKKAKIITSIAMFYDIEDPLNFMKQIHEILADDGVWVLEQSYMPTMLKVNAYDTICHEHIEYYRLKQIKWMAERAGLKILDVEFNDINGGSFSVMVAKSESPYHEKTKLTDSILQTEEDKGFDTLKPYKEFSESVYRHKDQLLQIIQDINNNNKKIVGYGASTKGNVMLQFCGLGPEEIPFIAEVNKDKFGCYTPVTHIPIISEQEAKAMNPDYLFVLPWHFKQNILAREREYLDSGGKLLFPLPEIEVV